MNKNFYDKFHAQTKTQKRLIDKDDYTNGHILKLTSKHGNKPKNVLNIGCGTGSVDFFLASQGYQVTAIDISQKAVNSCNSNAKNFSLDKNTKFVRSSLKDFQSRNKFDLILCIEVLEHIADDNKALKKINQLLNTEGTLILSTPSKNAPLHKLEYLKKVDKKVGHLRRYLMPDLKKKIKKAGLTVVEEIKAEGIVRNFIFTSSIGGKIILRLINRSALFRKFIKLADGISLRLFGESDLIIVAKKQ